MSGGTSTSVNQILYLLNTSSVNLPSLSSCSSASLKAVGSTSSVVAQSLPSTLQSVRLAPPTCQPLPSNLILQTMPKAQSSSETQSLHLTPGGSGLPSAHVYGNFGHAPLQQQHSSVARGGSLGPANHHHHHQGSSNSIHESNTSSLPFNVLPPGQNQSVVHVFSTELANRGTIAVSEGKFASIFDFHRNAVKLQESRVGPTASVAHRGVAEGQMSSPSLAGESLPRGYAGSSASDFVPVSPCLPSKMEPQSPQPMLPSCKLLSQQQPKRPGSLPSSAASAPGHRPGNNSSGPQSVAAVAQLSNSPSAPKTPRSPAAAAVINANPASAPPAMQSNSNSGSQANNSNSNACAYNESATSLSSCSGVAADEQLQQPQHVSHKRTFQESLSAPSSNMSSSPVDPNRPLTYDSPMSGCSGSDPLQKMAQMASESLLMEPAHKQPKLSPRAEKKLRDEDLTPEQLQQRQEKLQTLNRIKTLFDPSQKHAAQTSNASSTASFTAPVQLLGSQPQQSTVPTGAPPMMMPNMAYSNQMRPGAPNMVLRPPGGMMMPNSMIDASILNHGTPEDQLRWQQMVNDYYNNKQMDNSGAMPSPGPMLMHMPQQGGMPIGGPRGCLPPYQQILNNGPGNNAAMFMSVPGGGMMPAPGPGTSFILGGGPVPSQPGPPMSQAQSAAGAEMSMGNGGVVPPPVRPPRGSSRSAGGSRNKRSANAAAAAATQASVEQMQPMCLPAPGQMFQMVDGRPPFNPQQQQQFMTNPGTFPPGENMYMIHPRGPAMMGPRRMLSNFSSVILQHQDRQANPNAIAAAMSQEHHGRPMLINNMGQQLSQHQQHMLAMSELEAPDMCDMFHLNGNTGGEMPGMNMQGMDSMHGGGGDPYFDMQGGNDFLSMNQAAKFGTAAGRNTGDMGYAGNGTNTPPHIMKLPINVNKGPAGVFMDNQTFELEFGGPANPNMTGGAPTGFCGPRRGGGGGVPGGGHPPTVNNTFVNATMTIQQMNIQNVSGHGPFGTANMNFQQMNSQNMQQQQQFMSGVPQQQGNMDPSCQGNVQAAGRQFPGHVPQQQQHRNGPPPNVHVRMQAPNFSMDQRMGAMPGQMQPQSDVQGIYQTLAEPLTNLDSKVPSQKLQYFPASASSAPPPPTDAAGTGAQFGNDGNGGFIQSPPTGGGGGVTMIQSMNIQQQPQQQMMFVGGGGSSVADFMSSEDFVSFQQRGQSMLSSTMQMQNLQQQQQQNFKLGISQQHQQATVLEVPGNSGGDGGNFQHMDFQNFQAQLYGTNVRRSTTTTSASESGSANAYAVADNANSAK